MAGCKTWREIPPDIAQAPFSGRLRQWHDRRASAHRSQVGPLLGQIDQEIEKVIADGANDGAPNYQTIAQHGGNIEVVISARKTLFLARRRVQPISVIVILRNSTQKAG